MALYVLFVAVIAAVVTTVSVVIKETFASKDADPIEKAAVVVFSVLTVTVGGGLCLLMMYYCVKVGLELL